MHLNFADPVLPSFLRNFDLTRMYRYCCGIVGLAVYSGKATLIQAGAVSGGRAPGATTKIEFS